MPELNFYGVTNGTTLALRLSRMGENTASSCQLHCLRKITTLWFRICLYTFALLWTLLHPLISVTQLEQHPRKIFFDENALLPHSSPAYKIEEITSLSKKFQRSFTESTSKFKNHVKSVARNKPGSSRRQLRLLDMRSLRLFAMKFSAKRRRHLKNTLH